jgi:SAM-dependent methyltransferase
MVDLRARAHADNDRYVQAGRSAQQLGDSARQSAFATLFRDRGLSSDTRIDVDFSIDQALKALGARGSLPPGSIRRVAIVGPGLDFTDKAEGYDFYPQQTIQPFAVLDSLLRLSLAASADLHMTTFDLSPRVNQHLEAARQRAQSGTPYVLQLPLDGDSPAHQWNPDFEAYWQHVGARIGDDVPAIPSPPGASVRVRAVRVRPAMALSITPRDLNIVLERLAPLNEDDRFDLIIATNVLIYYNAFEQALALANVSAMLRPGGVFLTNYKIAPLPPVESSGSVITSFDRQGNGDTIFVYVRR